MDFKLLGFYFRLEVVILCVAVGYILGAHLFCSCLRITPMEGFEMLNDLKNVVVGRGSGSGSGSGRVSGSGSEKYDPNGEVLSGYNLETPNKNGIAKHLKENVQGAVIPLAEGKLDLFEKTTFSPECCPSKYSNSTGCACLSFEQMSHISTRGMNSTEESEF